MRRKSSPELTNCNSLLECYLAQALKYLSVVFKENPLKPLNPQQILPQH